MKPLGTNFAYKSFLYHQEWRNENFAIYSQWLNDKLIAYESIRIRKNKSQERYGKNYEASESYATDREWGINGFTSKTFEEAQKILFKHFPNLPNLPSPKRYKARTPPEAYQLYHSNNFN
ncbi:MAG: hypothetical protein ACYDA4_03855 [Ignavibacteriaceae bacterium]